MRHLAARLILAELGLATVRALIRGGPPARTLPGQGETRQTGDADLVRTEPSRLPQRALGAFVAIVLAGGVGFAIYSYERAQKRSVEAARLTGGDPARGEGALVRYGCSGCHTIPGFQRADGLVGPELGGLSQRIYIAGRLENSPDNLVRWIVDPKAFDPKTAMPRTGISETEARDIIAYLYRKP